MKIINLTASNIKRISVVDITPDASGVIVIEGKNAQGKTSVLDCILFALCGEKMIPDNVIKNGETEAEIKIELDDVIIRRTFKETGTTKLIIENKTDGSRIMAPQTWLDARLGKLSFDPLTFSRLDKAARVNEIKRVTGLDFSEVESKYNVAFEKRRMLNRDVETYAAQLKEFDKLAAPELTRSVAEIQKAAAASHDDAMRRNAAESERVSRVKTLKLDYQREMDLLSQSRGYIEDKLAEIKELEKEIAEERDGCVVRENKISDLKKLIDAAGSETPTIFSPVDMTVELNAAIEADKIREKLARRDSIKAAMQSVNVNIAALESEMSACKEAKSRMIKEAKMPVAGLTMTKDDVMIDGVAFDSISDAQKIQVSMAIAVSQNPEIKIVRIKEGSLLDKSMFDVVVKFAREKDFQVWIERVADEPSGDAIYIENGMIKKEVK